MQGAFLDGSSTIDDLIGNTPLIEIRHKRSESVQIFAKCEWFNPSGSVQDRVAYALFDHALKHGDLGNKILIDATSGNTGMALALLGAHFQIPVEIALPEDASFERKRLIQNYGAKLHLTSAGEGVNGAQNFVKRLVQEYPDRYYYSDHINNEQSHQAHCHGTGPEIWHQTEGNITHFVAGWGNTSSFVGTSQFLKEKEVHCVAVQSDNDVDRMQDYDETMRVSTLRACAVARSASCHLALPLSPSSGANVSAALSLAETLDKGRIVTVFADSAVHYLQESFWKDDDTIIENPFF